MGFQSVKKSPTKTNPRKLHLRWLFGCGDRIYRYESITTRITPPKTNMKMEKNNHLEMYLPLKMVIFECHVGLIERIAFLVGRESP